MVYGIPRYMNTYVNVVRSVGTSIGDQWTLRVVFLAVEVEAATF